MEQIEVIEQQKFFTVDEIAEQIGKTPDTVRKQLKRYGLEPTIAYRRTQDGTIPAMYDAAALAKIKEEEEELSLRNKQRNAAVKIAEGMSMVGKQAFVQTTYDELDLNEKTQFTLGSIQALLTAYAEDHTRLEKALSDERIRVTGWKNKANDSTWRAICAEPRGTTSQHDEVRDEMEYAEMKIERQIDPNYGRLVR